MNKIKVFLLALLAVSAITIFVAVIWVDRLVQTAIEVGATQGLGVQTQLDDVKIGLFSGRFGLSGLRVANPEHFDSDYFLQIRSGKVELSLGSLTQETVVLPKLTLSGITLNLDHNGKQGNFDVILENLHGQGAGEPPDTETGEKSTGDGVDDQSGKKFVIERVLVRDITVHATVFRIGGKPMRTTLEIPEIQLHNIGSDTDHGILMSQLSGVLLDAVLKSAIKQGADLIPHIIVEGLGGGLKGLGEVSEQIIKQTGSTVIGVGKEVEKALDQTTQHLQGALDQIFKGAEEKPKQGN